MKFKFVFFLPGLFALPNDFFIGTSTSSYQIEGHLSGNSIWDRFTQERGLEPVGNACNHYQLYKEDVKLIHNLNIQHYRFSISWTRIMPSYWNVIDPVGIRFYHDLLDELIFYNITPYVTMYHWDLPDYIQRDWNGWANKSISNLFLEYSKILFREYDSKVNFWITINEPLTTSDLGYGKGQFAPGITTEKYSSGHHQLLAHAYVAKYYKDHYRGKIGIALNSNWFEPINSKSKAQQELEKTFGWFADPLFLGDYPQILKKVAPKFSSEEKIMLTSSLDFLGLNHYTTYYIDSNGNYVMDPLWIQGKSKWLYDVPWGMNKILHYINNRYGSIPIYITETGFSMKNDSFYDSDRINYLSGYLSQTLDCIQEGINVKGFFIWSFLDNFEWASGYNEKFGIVYVNRTTFERTPKSSALLIKSILTN